MIIYTGDLYWEVVCGTHNCEWLKFYEISL